MKTATWNRLLATTVISGVASMALASPALAQTQTPPPGGDEEVPVPQSPAPTTGGQAPEVEVDEEGVVEDGSAGTTIVVTGSRIPRPDLTSVSPVTVVNDEQIELTGTQTLDSLLNDLPQVVTGVTRSSNNPSGFGGFATLDLRNLGPNRTLILVDGERLPPSNTLGYVDVSLVPVGLIQRVDVVTGGASAVYGSDAVAGVINFILKQDFEGIEVTGQAGIAEEGVGADYNISGLLGGNFADDRGNAALFASYYERQSVDVSRYDYARVAGAQFIDPNTGRLTLEDDPNDVPDGFLNFIVGGSVGTPGGPATGGFTNLATLFPNQFTNVDADCNPATPGVTINSGSLFINPDGTISPFLSAGFLANNRCGIPVGNSSRYNFAPPNVLVLPLDRFNLTGLAHYDFTERTTLRVFANYTGSNIGQQLAPTPAISPSTGFVFDPNETMFIPPQLQAALDARANPDAPFSFSRRFSETGPRVGNIQSDAILGRLTLSHELNPDWDIDGTLSWGRVNRTDVNRGNVNRTAVEQGVRGCRNDAGVVNGPGVLPGCIPVNIFGEGNITPEMVDFIVTNTTDVAQFEQGRAAVNLAGSMGPFWGGGGPIGVALGAEYRRDEGSDTPDDAKVRGEIIGFNAAQPQAGSIETREIYGEVRVPLLEGAGFPDLLAIELGGRYSDYSSVGGLFNWKVGAEFAPVPWLRFRGTMNRAARAPNVFELFRAGDQQFPPYADPCNSPVPDPQTAARCAAAGVPANFAQPNQQVQAFAFGQPDLSEERAETMTLGAVFNPTWWPLGRFSLTADYFDIEVNNIIQALGPNFYLNQCYGQGNQTACARIQRDPASGVVTAIDLGMQNSDDPLRVRGIDVGANWSVPMARLFGGGGQFRIANLFTYNLDYKIGDTEFVDTVGAGLGNIISKYANSLTVGYDTPAFTIQGRYVYESSGDYTDAYGDNFQEDICEALGGNNCDVERRIPDLHYLEASTRWTVSDRYELTFIVKNLLDKLPPQTAVNEQNNIQASFYNPLLLGRSYTAQAKVRF